MSYENGDGDELILSKYTVYPSCISEVKRSSVFITVLLLFYREF